MRLWSIHLKYLDQKGLCGLWREALQAQRVLLQGEYEKCGCNKGKICVGFSSTDRPIYEQCFNCKGTGKIKTPYWNHPQLERFKKYYFPLRALNWYLYEIWREGIERGYKFDKKKINLSEYEMRYKDKITPLLTVTKGQLEYETKHLTEKLQIRDKTKVLYNHCRNQLRLGNIEPHPLFKVIEGEIESWEKIKK